jgi:energy-coupling factor transporter ATP-binding protein EcfA2
LAVDWQHADVLLPTGLALVTAIAVHQVRRRTRNSVVVLRQNDTPVTWDVIKAWITAGERAVQSDEPDLFGTQSIAIRIVEAVQRGQSIALLGPFGSGKSTILNTVRAELKHRQPLVIVAQMNVWAIPRPEDVPRFALTRILAALDAYIDTIDFRGLPASYQRLAAAEPTGRLSKALGVDSVGDPISEVERLTPVLEALNARLLLTVEDAERAGEGFETRYLERLLWTLRGVRRASFVLALDHQRAKLDYPKLCDSIELVPAMGFESVARLVKIAHAHWMNEFSFIDPHPNRAEGDKLRLAHTDMGSVMDYVRRTGGGMPIDALIELLQTPRALKHVFRRVDRVWRTLYGEVELDDVLIVSAIRHGAEPAFKFLVSEIDAARHEPDDFLPRTKTVKEGWQAILKTLPNGAAVQDLVNLLGIEQFSSHADTVKHGPQSVHAYEPVDYFRRIVAEDLGPAELRDQGVLSDIDAWRDGTNATLVNRMIESNSDTTYPRRWKHFSTRHTDEDLMRLTEEVVRRLLARDGASANVDHSAIGALLWGAGGNRLRRDTHTEWFRSLVVTAVPVSLRFVNGLYRYWAGNDSLVSYDRRIDIRRSIIDACRATIRSPDDLVRVLSPEEPFNVRWLLTATGAEEPDYETWRSYLPPMIVEAGRIAAETITPELAMLAGEGNSLTIAAGGVYPPVFLNPYKIDRQRMSALFGDRLDETLALLADYRGDNAYTLRAKDAAKDWLEERRQDRRGSIKPTPGPAAQD